MSEHTLSIDNLVPSALATAASPSVSKRYQFLSTKDVVEGLLSEGMTVAKSLESRTWKPEKMGYQRHQVFLDFPSDDGGHLMKGEYKYQMRVVNSHCRTSALQVFLGAYVMVCSNGLVIPSGEQTTMARFRHVHSAPGIREIIELCQERAVKTNTTIVEMQSREMTWDEQLQFAEYAIGLRWPKGTGNQVFTPQHVIANPRSSQADPTLWNTFNTIQESMIRGFSYQGTSQRGGRVRPVERQTRGVKNIKKDLSLNMQLWRYAEELALA